jgi:hypothetical protein
MRLGHSLLVAAVLNLDVGMGLKLLADLLLVLHELQLGLAALLLVLHELQLGLAEDVARFVPGGAVEVALVILGAEFVRPTHLVVPGQDLVDLLLWHFTRKIFSELASSTESAPGLSSSAASGGLAGSLLGLDNTFFIGRSWPVTASCAVILAVNGPSLPSIG